MVSCMCQHASEAKVPAALYSAVVSSVWHELLLVPRAQNRGPLRSLWTKALPVCSACASQPGSWMPCSTGILVWSADDATAFFQRCKKGLKPGGLVVVKENICSSGFIHDKEDSSLTRSHQYMLELFKSAGMTLVSSAQQRNFPKDLFQVHMYALKPQGP